MPRICVLLLWCHLTTISGLKSIDNGVGLIVWGAEEKVVDYAVLDDDQVAALPSQVESVNDDSKMYLQSFKLIASLHTLY